MELRFKKRQELLKNYRSFMLAQPFSLGHLSQKKDRAALEEEYVILILESCLELFLKKRFYGNLRKSERQNIELSFKKQVWLLALEYYATSKKQKFSLETYKVFINFFFDAAESYELNHPDRKNFYRRIHRNSPLESEMIKNVAAPIISKDKKNLLKRIMSVN